MQVSLKAYGENSILAYDLSASAREALCRDLSRERPPACLEYVEGYDTVLFIFGQPTETDVLRGWLDGIQAGPANLFRSPVRVIPVTYDGPDLESVAEQAGLSVAELIERHSAPIYTVRMMGFAPGFPYLDGLDQRLRLPRMDSPRDRVEPGSVAIGGPHAGIYSVASPGGWHLLGRTEVQLFNPDAARAADPHPGDVFLFSPGDRLRFQAIC
ncbi:MAG: 5-oxoprolinase subunit B family protein [Opitutales bacterium]